MLCWEAVTVAVLLSLALLSALGAIWGKLSAIAVAVDGLVKSHQRDREDRVRIWGRLDDHEARIIGLESHHNNPPPTQPQGI